MSEDKESDYVDDILYQTIGCIIMACGVIALIAWVIYEVYNGQ